LTENLVKNTQYPITSISSSGVITFAAPISATPGARLYLNETSSISRNDTYATVVSQTDATTVTINGTASATGGYAILEEPRIIKGNFGNLNRGNVLMQPITSISNGTVTLATKFPSNPKVNDLIYISSTSDPNQTRLVKVNTVAADGLSFTTLHPAMQASSTGGTAQTQAYGSQRERKLGTTQEIITCWKVDDTTLATNKIIWNDYPAGTGIFDYIQEQLSMDTPPPLERIYHWGNFFPAMDIDVGQPLAPRVDPWKTAAASGVKNGIVRRDYEHAVILMSFPNSIWRSTPLPPTYGLQPSKAQTMTGYSPAYPIDVNGVPITVYPLQADGRTSNAQCNYGPGEDYRTPDGGCSRVKIRTAEGLVLMKKPVN
jgi:hypothetical protein